VTPFANDEAVAALDRLFLIDAMSGQDRRAVATADRGSR
jgi:hypothetical protein